MSRAGGHDAVRCASIVAILPGYGEPAIRQD